MGTSQITNEEFYSGDWVDVRNLCRVLNIGEGKLSKITQNLVEYYQEMIDREIDGSVEQYYYTPLRPYNQYMPASGTTKKIFPGAVRSLARYWTAGALLLSEFQSLDQNTNEAAQNYVEESKRKLYELISFTRRIPGQILRHNLRTMPPTMAPGTNPEFNL